MALIGQHQQTSFANPQNGQSPMDADVVRGNDNATVAKHNSHDNDATIHVQTGLLASRPAAGTAGAMYMDENGRLYRDNGAAWAEVPYARLTATSSTFTGDVIVQGNFGVDGNVDVYDVDAQDIVADNVTATGAVSGSSVVSTGNVTAGGTVSGASFSGAGTGLTGIPADQLTSVAIPSGTINATNIPASRLTAGTAQGAITAPGLTSSAGYSMTGGNAVQTPRTATISASTHTIDCSTGNWFERTVDASTTISFSNFAAGQEIRVLVKQGAAGGFTVTWSGVNWAAAAGAPVLTTTANRWDTYLFVKRNDGTVMGFVGEQNHQ